MTTENRPRAPKETVSSGRASARDRARLDRIDAIDAMGDIDYHVLADLEIAEAEALAPCEPADRVRVSSVIDYFGEAMADLAPGASLDGWSKSEARAHAVALHPASAALNRPPYRMRPQVAPQSIERIIRRSVAWTRAEMGAVDTARAIGSEAIATALEMGRRAWFTLASLRAWRVPGDRAVVFVFVQALAEYSHQPDAISHARMLGRRAAVIDLDASHPGWRDR